MGAGVMRFLASCGLALVLLCAAAPKFVAAADIGEKNVSTDPTAMSPDLAVYTAVVFLIVLVVLWRFAWGPISKALIAREQYIADNIAAAERQNQEARRLLGEHQKKLE